MIGPSHARALFVTGRTFDAGHAKSIGLVHEVVRDETAMAQAQERLSGEILAAAPGAVVQARKLVWDVWGRPIDHDLVRDTARRLAHQRVSDEGREGVAAFLQKRRPDWAG